MMDFNNGPFDMSNRLIMLIHHGNSNARFEEWMLGCELDIIWERLMKR